MRLTDGAGGSSPSTPLSGADGAELALRRLGRPKGATKIVLDPSVAADSCSSALALQRISHQAVTVM
jgi:hypothetical protein